MAYLHHLLNPMKCIPNITAKVIFLNCEYDYIMFLHKILQRLCMAFMTKLKPLLIFSKTSMFSALSFSPAWSLSPTSQLGVQSF